MKINKLTSICKRAGMINLYNEENSDVQWCGTNEVIYPLYSLPVLDGDSIGAVLSLSDKEMDKIVVTHRSIPARYDVRDTVEYEVSLGTALFEFTVSGSAYQAYKRPNDTGVIIINPAYLKPLFGGEDLPELYLRSAGFAEYVVAKNGLMVSAIIEPELGVLSEAFIRNLAEFYTAACGTLEAAAAFAAVPQTDPATGEIV